MGENPVSFQILLLLAEKQMANEADLLAALMQEGSVQIVRDRTEALLHLREERRCRTLVIAHLRATLTDGDSLAGYLDFLHSYTEARKHSPLALLILDPPLAEWPNERRGGWGDLVAGYLRVNPDETLDTDLLLTFVRRIRTEAFKTE
jgi:hypothetical protein